MSNNNAAGNLFLNQKVVQTATNYTALANDVIIEVISTAVPCTITLPSASANNSGKFYIIKDTSGSAATNNITILPASGTIDGAASVIISTNYGTAQVFSDGSNYFILFTSTTGALLAQAGFSAFSTTPLTITPTVVASSSAWTTLFPLSARLAFSAIPQTQTPVNINVATQNLTVIQSGLYSISFICIGTAATAGNIVLQLVNNGSIVQVDLSTNRAGLANQVILNYLGPFTAGNTIDVRLGNTNVAHQVNGISFYIAQTITN